MQPEKYALILAAFCCGSETPAPSGGAANYAARMRHALVAVALLRGVAAHEAKACREWGHPKEGKWQKDEDCCAGVEQAACAAGYRYVKGCVEILRRVRAESSRHPPRHRRDACSIA